MVVVVPVGRELVRVSDTGTLTCTCRGGSLCVHIEAVVAGDVTLPAGPVAKALSLVTPDVKIQVLTRRLASEKDQQRRFAIQAAVAQLLIQLGA